MPQKPSEESEASRIKQNFKKKSELTRIFDDWDKPAQDFFLKHAKLEHGEFPVLAYRNPDVSWFLMTTRRLLWTNPSHGSFELRHEEIENVGWSSGPQGWPGQVESGRRDADIYTGNGGIGHCCHHSPWLHIIDSSGNRYELFLEKGNLIGMRNSIWQLSSGNYNAAKRAEMANRETAENSPPTGSDAYRARRVRRALAAYLEPTLVIETKNDTHNTEQQPDKLRITLFEELEHSWQKLFSAEATLQTGEVPIVACFKDAVSWSLITSRRFLWSASGEKHQLNFWEISSATSSYGPGGSVIDWVDPKDIPDYEKRVFPKKLAMIVSPWLCIQDTIGMKHEVFLHGMYTYALLTAVDSMIRMEKVHPRDAATVQASFGVEASKGTRGSTLFAGWSIQSVFDKFKTDPIIEMNFAFSELENKWHNLWVKTSQSWRLLSAATSENTSIKEIEENYKLLGNIYVHLGIQCQALSRIRKCVLWSLILFQPAALKVISREFSHVTHLVITQFNQCLKFKHEPDPDETDELMHIIDNLHKTVLDRMEDSTRMTPTKQAPLATFAQLQELESALRNRLKELNVLVESIENQGATATEGEPKQCSGQRHNWERSRQCARAILETVEKAKAKYQ